MNVPDEPELKLTVPDGVLGVPPAESVTAAVHVVVCPTVTDAGEQETEVEVMRLLTMRPNVPVLVW